MATVIALDIGNSSGERILAVSLVHVLIIYDRSVVGKAAKHDAVALPRVQPSRHHSS